MELKDQVCSLILAKRLKELGVEQDSYFYYYNRSPKGEESDWIITDLNDYMLFSSSNHEEFSAFTVAELGEMLPESLNLEGIGDYIFITKGHEKNKWSIVYRRGNGDFVCGFSTESSEADARANMLIYLIENGLINLRDK